jgi:hypothetical protein
MFHNNIRNMLEKTNGISPYQVTMRLPPGHDDRLTGQGATQWDGLGSPRRENQQTEKTRKPDEKSRPRQTISPSSGGRRAAA